MIGGFIDQLVDWRDFERFVRDLYAEDPDLLVEHNVTEAGRSGAPRQIDVKITRDVGGRSHVTLVECKRWKSKVDRARVDVLAASIEDLGARSGVIFTTSGYERGAETYARHKGIALFVIRDLTEEEWGLPGRNVWFYWHLYAARPINLDPGRPVLVPVIENPPTSAKLELAITKDERDDPGLTLRSITDGAAGPNLLSLVLEARQRTLDLLAPSLSLFDGGADKATRAFIVPVRLDLSRQPYRQLLRNYGALRFTELTMDLIVTVSQARFEYDRGDRLDVAVAVENFVTRQRKVVTRTNASSAIRVIDVADQSAEDEDTSGVLQNGALLRIFTEPWVSVGRLPPHAQRTKAVAFALPAWDVSVTAGSPHPPPSSNS